MEGGIVKLRRGGWNCVMFLTISTDGYKIQLKRRDLESFSLKFLTLKGDGREMVSVGSFHLIRPAGCIKCLKSIIFRSAKGTEK